MDNNVKKIKTYSRKVGKRLTDLAKSLLLEYLPIYEIDYNTLQLLDNLHVEIGFGDGVNLYNMAVNNPEKNFLGIEAYTNGVCNLLKLCKVQSVKNLFIYLGDADVILDRIPEQFVDAFYILFPDPWPKLRQNKRRFLNNQRLGLLKSKLKNTGSIRFITDITNYFSNVLQILEEINCIIFDETNFHNLCSDYIITKYHQKALLAQRSSKGLLYTKKNQP